MREGGSLPGRRAQGVRSVKLKHNREAVKRAAHIQAAGAARRALRPPLTAVCTWGWSRVPGARGGPPFPTRQLGCSPPAPPSRYGTLGNKVERTDPWATPLCRRNRADSKEPRVDLLGPDTVAKVTSDMLVNGGQT